MLDKLKFNSIPIVFIISILIEEKSLQYNRRDI